MRLLSRILRLGLVGISLVVLSRIVPISLTHIQTGNACPSLGPIPACYVVSAAYAAMGIAALLWRKQLSWLFYTAAMPVVLLAATGTSLELLGRPTCPRSETGWPICYSSLMVGVTMAGTFMLTRFLEQRQSRNAHPD